MTENHSSGLKKLEYEEGWAKPEWVGLPKHSLIGIYIVFHLKFNDSSMQKTILKAVARALRSLLDGYQINNTLSENQNI